MATDARDLTVATPDERVNVRLEEVDGTDEVTISEPNPVEVSG